MINIDNVVGFCIEELSINKDVDIHIYVDNLFEEDEVKGLCTNSSDVGDFDKNEYQIELDENLDDDEMLITLCHEMVHVKQYSEGRDADEDEAYELETVLLKKYKEVFLAV